MRFAASPGILGRWGRARATHLLLKTLKESQKQGETEENSAPQSIIETPGTLSEESIGRVKVLHDELEKLEERGRKCGLEYAETARQLGRALLDLQDELKHGERVKVITQAVPRLATATIYRYMRLAKEHPTAESLTAALAKHKTLAALYGHIDRPGTSRKLEPASGGESESLVCAVQDSLKKTRKSVTALVEAVNAASRQQDSTISTNETEQIAEVWKQVTVVARDTGAISDAEILQIFGESTEGGEA